MAIVRPSASDDAPAMLRLRWATMHERAAGHHPRPVLDAWSPPVDGIRIARLRAAMMSGTEVFVVAAPSPP